MKITIVAGARPNFMKIAPLIHSINKSGSNIKYRLVHTGQHYDVKMSDTFFNELKIPNPDVNLGCGGGSQAEQTAAIMVAFEKELKMNPADVVIVVGDVTSTMACAIVAKKLNTKVAHIEAGIRSFDLSMPEEINRMVTDSISDYFFTTTLWAGENLKKSGIEASRIIFVGNVMIDTLLANMNNFKKPFIWDKMGLREGSYLVMTMHRPANVDEQEKLREFMINISNHVRGLPVIFPIHPRTRIKFEEAEITAPNVYPIDPLSYLEFNYLVKHAKCVITDSGGITEETTVMGVPCMTLRENTERPETVEIGTNEIVGTNPNSIQIFLNKLFENNWKNGAIPELWDGNAAIRIVDALQKICIN